MEIIDIPFLKKVGVRKKPDGELELPFSEDVQNHFQAICAGAQYTLAESSAGELLSTLYPELVGKVIPVIRETKIKFRKPALGTASAISTVSDDIRAKFEEQFSKDGRGFISIDVKVRDMDEGLTCTGTFLWFIQRIDQESDLSSPAS